MDQQRAQHFAEQWYAAWNAHDLTAIFDHYTDDIEIVSPLVPALTGSDDNTIAGKDALRTYFTAGLEKYPELHFEPIELFVGVDSLVLNYRGAGGNLAAEVISLDSQEKITRYSAHYTQP